MDVFDAWKNTCNVLLGSEIGSLDDYSSNLEKYTEKIIPKKSVLSGKDITISSESFCKNAKFISQTEQADYAQILSDVKLNINEIKDIDSIVSAISDKFYYAGDQIAGNAIDVKNCDSCTNSSFIYKSNELYDCRHMGFSSVLRFCENCFGTSGGGESKFMINCYEVFEQKRCFETFRAYTSSDCYYSANLEDCMDCIFCFNQKNGRNKIGNLQLEKDEYVKLKKKLIDEIRVDYESKKNIPSIIDILRD